MSQVEVAYELRNAADYLILSPAEIWDKGFPYFKMVKYLLATDNTKQNAINIAKDFVNFYENECTERIPWATIAVIKTIIFKPIMGMGVLHLIIQHMIFELLCVN